MEACLPCPTISMTVSVKGTPVLRSPSRTIRFCSGVREGGFHGWILLNCPNTVSGRRPGTAPGFLKGGLKFDRGGVAFAFGFADGVGTYDPFDPSLRFGRPRRRALPATEPLERQPSSAAILLPEMPCFHSSLSRVSFSSVQGRSLVEVIRQASVRFR